MLAIAAAMQIMGASYVETLDTKGTDGSNVHLGGPGDDHRLLRRHRPAQRSRAEVGGRVPLLLHHLRHAPGAEHQPRHGAGRLPAAQAGRRQRVQDLGLHGQRQPVRRPVDADRRQALLPRRRHLPADRLQLEQLGQQRDDRDHGRGAPGARLRGRRALRASHHRDLEEHRASSRTTGATSWSALADHVPNISAKHEGGDPDVEQTRAHPSDILDYFRAKDEVIERRLGACSATTWTSTTR